MKTKFIDEKFCYDGTQLSPLYAYLNHGLLGNSIVAWIGSCRVDPDHMIDGEDVLQGAQIAGGEMLHFIVEVFDRDLFSGVCLQRLLASQIKDILTDQATLGTQILKREGDDLFWGLGKLSISIASRSSISVQLHFAMNVINEGTPVVTSCLCDLDIQDVPEFANTVMGKFANEFEDILKATQKVRPLVASTY